MTGADAFSVGLAPHAAVAEARGAAAGARGRILGRALARYLAATWVLEEAEVQPVVAALADGAVAGCVAGPSAVAKLRAEEDRHAAEARALLAAVPGAETPETPPAFRARLEAALRAAPDEDRSDLRFLFVVGTETVVSDQMHRLARDPAVRADVRGFVAAHARDEAWHATWFGGRVAEAWAAWSPERRARLGAVVPALLRAWLAPDPAAEIDDLVAEGLARETARSTVAELRPAEAARDALARAAAPTLVHLRAAGLGGCATTAAAFEAAGLPLGSA